jgi:hypothetical protein
MKSAPEGTVSSLLGGGGGLSDWGSVMLIILHDGQGGEEEAHSEYSDAAPPQHGPAPMPSMILLERSNPSRHQTCENLGPTLVRE